MDIPFDPSKWQPTRGYETWEKQYSETDILQLGQILASNTKDILTHPYDARTWIKRSYTLKLLRYPELAAGDGFKAAKLCRNVVEVLEGNTKPNFRLGVNMGFWMRHEEDEDDEDGGGGGFMDGVDDDVEEYLASSRGGLHDVDLDEEHELQAAKFATLLSEAEKMILDNLDYAPNREEGLYSPRAYPWMKEEYWGRTDKTLEDIEKEFQESHRQRCGAKESVPCFSKRYAFGVGIGPNDGKDVIGVFANRELTENEVVLVDKSRLWVSLVMNSDSCASKARGKCNLAFADPLDRAALVLEQRTAAWSTEADRRICTAAPVVLMSCIPTTKTMLSSMTCVG